MTTPPALEKTDKRETLHLFNPGIARIYGLEAALIYQHIKWVCSRRGRYSITKSQMLTMFPYLSRKQIITALAQLLNPRKSFEPAILERSHEKVNPTYRLFGSASKSKKLHGFDPEIASATGSIAAAVVYDDVLRWIVENDYNSDTDEEPTHYESPAQWASAHTYLPLRTVERAFQLLKESGLLLHRGYAYNRTPKWTIPLGVGKMDRWKMLHKWVRKEKVNKSKTKFVYVPVLADRDSHPEFFDRQNGTTHRQKGTTDRQNGTTHRQKGTTNSN